jgi:hypothetical protein
VVDRHPERILDPEGNPLCRYARGDSEGLAIALDGRAFVSLEGDVRVRVGAHYTACPPAPPGTPTLDRMWENARSRALAVVRSEAFSIRCPSDLSSANGFFPVYAFRHGAWEEAFRVPSRESFAVAGADVGPDGGSTSSSATFAGLGFRTGLRRLNLDGTGDEVLLTTATGTHDNLEGSPSGGTPRACAPP